MIAGCLLMREQVRLQLLHRPHTPAGLSHELRAEAQMPAEHSGSQTRSCHPKATEQG